MPCKIVVKMKTISKPSIQSSGYSFQFKLSYKFLKLSDAKLRYGNQTQRTYRGKLSVGSYCDRLLEVTQNNKLFITGNFFVRCSTFAPLKQAESSDTKKTISNNKK
ncbi:hypothetical protein D910_07128 [Dendroctonus ponderosae]